MKANSKVLLVTQTRVKQDKEQQFAQWQEMVNNTIRSFPGYISQTITPPNIPIQLDWVIVQHFTSIEHAKKWLQSQERQELLKKVRPILVGIDDVYLVEEKNQNQGTVTATISTMIHPKDEERFLEWNTRVSANESKFAGFLGSKIERPRPGINDAWITIVTFDSDEHLDAWLNSNERKKLINELNSFIIESHMRKVYSGFDFWFAPSQDNTHSAWKENMLVLLTLYPVVFLLSYAQNPVMSYGVPFWLALFFSNAISTAILGWISVPWLMKHFWWWLNPPQQSVKKYTFLGTFIVLCLYGISLFIFWRLSANS